MTIDSIVPEEFPEPPKKPTPEERTATRVEARRLIVDLLTAKSLYAGFSLKTPEGEMAEEILRGTTLGTFDCYCMSCKRETPFIVAPVSMMNTGGGNIHRSGSKPNLLSVKAVCTRSSAHSYEFVFKTVGTDLIKVGQYPSFGSIAMGELKGVDKSLEPLDRKELGTALGLFSHDAASGAFVYLRRVFERMIHRAYERHSKTSGPIEGFDTLRMDDKISALKGELPEKVVEHKKVFSVLSAGIHELTDEQCRDLFPVVKAVIFQLLEDEEHKRRKSLADKDTDRAFADLQQKMFGTEGQGGAAGASEQPAT